MQQFGKKSSHCKVQSRQASSPRDNLRETGSLKQNEPNKKEFISNSFQTVDKVSIERSRLFSCRKFPTRNGAGAESRGSTLTAEQIIKSGRATLDAATRIILDCDSSGEYAAVLPPGEGKDYDPSLRAALRHLLLMVCGS